MAESNGGVQKEFEWLHSDLKDIKDWVKDQDGRIRKLEVRVYILAATMTILAQLFLPKIKLPL